MAARSKMVASPTGKRRTMFIPVGLPGSGKSWIAKRLDKANFMIINQDERKWSFEELHRHVMWAATVGTNRHLYIDSCNQTKKRRAALLNIALKADMQVVFLLFTLPLEQCIFHTTTRILSREIHPSVNDEEAAERSRGAIIGSWEDITQGEYTRYTTTPGINFIIIPGVGKAADLVASFNERA